MDIGVFLFGGVEMEQLGQGAPLPVSRRYTQEDFFDATRRILGVGAVADELGYDSFWLTEHHFQHEGYEVIPNGILLGAFLAERTRRIGIGTMFNVLGQWHPLRLAEDFSMLHNLSGGRAILGLGRGTVPREMLPLSSGRSSVGSADNPDQAAADLVNREVFDESLDLLLACLTSETFQHSGKHFAAPPGGIPDRGGEVAHLTLVPRPLYPFDVWQAATSPATLKAIPKRGFGGVFWLQNHATLKRRWGQFADDYEREQGRVLGLGEKRMAVLNTHIADTHEQAIERARPGHDEFWRFLGPYGWNSGYVGPDGGAAPKDWVPALEDSIAQGQWIVGTADEVGGRINDLADDIGLANLTLFPSMPGERYDLAEEQLQRFAENVRPSLHSSALAR